MDPGLSIIDVEAMRYPVRPFKLSTIMLSVKNVIYLAVSEVRGHSLRLKVSQIGYRSVRIEVLTKVAGMAEVESRYNEKSMEFH